MPKVGSKQLEKDVKDALERFPKLRLVDGPKQINWRLEGELDICDQKGHYWGTFDLLILIPPGYPFCIPIVIERSKAIPRLPDRHISREGVCCLDIDHQMIYLQQKGIQLSSFISSKVYPYFANQLYFKETGQFAGGEFAHDFEGVRQFYAESLQLEEPAKAVKIIESILQKKRLNRNETCVCGSKIKFKKCHLDSVAFLSVLGMVRLQKDLDGFSRILSPIEAKA